MRIYTRLIAVASLLIILASCHSLAQRLNEGSLRGLTTVAVVILLDKKHDESAPDLKSLLSTAVELKLRQSGIKVAQHAESIFLVEIGILDLPINEKEDYHTYAVETSIVQHISFKRNGRTIHSPHSKIWHRGPSIGGESGYSKLKQHILDNVDAFLNDWLADNQD
jgi:hypothetical protein